MLSKSPAIGRIGETAMEHKHQHFLMQLSEHRDAFRKVGELVQANEDRVLDEWRAAFWDYFGEHNETAQTVVGLAGSVVDRIIETLLSWEPRSHLDNARRIGETLAGRRMPLEDVVISYHLLQEVLMRLIRETMPDDFADAWAAIEDFYGHSLAVVVRGYHDAVDKKRQEANAEDKREFTEQLEMARIIQGKLIPERFQNHYLKAVARLIAVDIIGGDIFFAHRVNDQLAFFAIADAEGHGLPAALTMMSLSAHFQTVLSNYYTPEYVAEYLNWMIIKGESGIPPTSAIALTIDGRKGELRYVNAGHPNPILISEADGSVHTFEHGHLVLGLSKKEVYKPETIKFGAGDKLILFTDGLMDFKRPGGDLLGSGRLVEFVKDNRHLSGEELLNKLMAWLEQEERAGGQRTDDILAVAIEARRAEWRTILVPDVDIPVAKMMMLSELRGLDLPHELISDLHVVMDELIDNALCHGNQMDLKLPIQLEYMATPEEFRIRVTDSGPGFDWRSLDMLMSKDKLLSGSGRGLYFIKSLMDEVTFNEKGNQVTSIKRFDR